LVKSLFIDRQKLLPIVVGSIGAHLHGFLNNFLL
jgi:hypothetical protein